MITSSTFSERSQSELWLRLGFSCRASLVTRRLQHELEIVCDAAHIPTEIHISLEGLEIGDSIHISSVKLPNGVTPANSEEDFTVATIVAPSAMKSEEEEAAAEGEVPTVGEEGEEAEGGEAAEGGESEE